MLHITMIKIFENLYFYSFNKLFIHSLRNEVFSYTYDINKYKCFFRANAILRGQK
jgi:hypothetical protein